MHAVPVIETERLLLREWHEEDREPFAKLNGDARVTEHFPALITRENSDAFVDRAIAGWERGFGFWAVEVRTTEDFIGFIGLSVPTWEAPFGPAIEIGWRPRIRHRRRSRRAGVGEGQCAAPRRRVSQLYDRAKRPFTQGDGKVGFRAR